MVTVVIATRDRAALLEQTLAALGRQELDGVAMEVLIVDNASSDRTREVVAEAAAILPGIVYLYEGKPGKSHALNSALERARGEILLLTDDDVVPGKGWVQAFVRAFAETGADYAVGRIFPLWEVPPPRWMSEALHGVLAIPDGGPRRRLLSKGVHEDIMPIGANMAVRRAVIERIGGWNPDLGKLGGTLRTGEDHEFALRMLAAGFTGVYEPTASVGHHVPASRLRLGYFARWFYDNGAIVAGLERTYPSSPARLLGVPRYLWRQLASDLRAVLAATVRADLAQAVAACMRVLWFGGFIKDRWSSARRSPSGWPRPVSPRG
jgi:glycosyltransferase involved in cell wall biosynthesis